MVTFTPIEAQERDKQRNPRQLRSAGILPGTVYGKGTTPVSIQIENRKDFATLLKQGHTHFELKALNLKVKAQQIQYHNTEFELLNVEFLAVS